mmetsp:Transcript_19692/g.62548  ORF Transcript_19692/g.62548 Transcript_19692/m.62548 type:complete len:217 (+) Transcript_19692:98-748(+)
MVTVVGTSGSSTITGWNLLVSAASFSMYLRYSVSVVAPTHRSSPRASIGFNRFDASMEPSAAPAPTSMCISSMNKMMPPLLALTSASTSFRRSSNSPRNLAPATSAPRSNATTRLFFMLSGTCPATMRCARPSTTAVLPTPASPAKATAFLVRRDRIWIVRRISSPRPITGSSLPSSASVVRSWPYFLRASPRTRASGCTHGCDGGDCCRQRTGVL